MSRHAIWALVPLFVACGDDSTGTKTDAADSAPADTASDTSPTDTASDTSPVDTGDDVEDTARPEVDTVEPGDGSDVIEPGAFLSPCLENRDCNSGFCIETDEGSVCTRDCVEDCIEGWRCAGVQTPSADVRFVCLPQNNRLCLPCTVDYQCGGGFCLEDAAGNEACTVPCGVDDECPNGFVCEERTSDEDATRVGKQCVPSTGRCDCTARNDGEVRPCAVENAFGRCWGAEVCDGEGGWSACDARAPALEVCDGQDDDCDGVVDEELEAPLEACENVSELGSCVGVWSCGGASGWTCDADEPSAELCNYLDDDCDGVPDDGFRAESGLYLDDDNCGVCGNSCDGKIPFATATACAEVDGKAVCIATGCEAGYFIPIETKQACVPRGGGFLCSSCFGDENCLDLPDGRCELLDGEYHCTQGCQDSTDCELGYECDGGRCLPVSRSCDCLVDNAGIERGCRNANEAGVCFGTQVCDPEVGWTECSASMPMDEACNGLDDNCNQRVDEDVVHDPATCQVENDFGVCGATWYCLGAAGWQCEADTPAAEICNYVDDDCDGEIDEGIRDVASGQYLALDHCGACGISCVGALPNATERCGLSPEGTARCEVATCDAGYTQQGPLACVPANTASCQPCESDAACQGGVCSELVDGSFCLSRCDSDENCVSGYTCQARGDAKVCVPPTNACICDGSNTALFRGCTTTYEPPAGMSYECFGTSQCTAAGWSECEVFGEECNLLDDDCDGQTDEDFLVDGRFATDENCGQCGNDCTLLDFPGGGGVCNDNVDPPRCSLRCGEGCVDLNANPNDGCECCNPSPEDFPDPLGIDSNCDGIDGERDNSIFVAKWGADTNSGLWGSPKLTLQAGIEAAKTLGKRDVITASGIYREAIDLRLGVGVYGGYESDFSRRDAGLFETVILGPDPTADKPAAVNAVGLVNGVNFRTVIDGFAIYGADVKSQGASSFAVRIVDSDDSVRLTNNRVYAGSGGKGRRGLDGVDGADAPGGTEGVDAYDVFEKTGVTGHNCVTPSPGGTGGRHSCGGIDTSGGDGGNRVCPTWDDNLDATSLPKPSESGRVGQNGAAGGGAPGRDVFHQRFSCEGYDTYGPVEGTDGQDGGDGGDGGSGLGCFDADGAILGGVWIAGTAQDGMSGRSGGGGGGGGSGAGAYVHESCNAKGLYYDNIGGTGGGAGAGGCGGTQGTAGTSGGGAFGVLVLFSTAPTTVPQIADNVIHGGQGGDGGDGGNAGVGGSGGAGALGGLEGGDYETTVSPPIVDPSYPAFKGGKGGKGGNGGHGGGGGGGCGGPSYGIYVAGQGGANITEWALDNAFPVLGSGGSGGLGGFSLGQTGGGGAPGATGATNF